MINYNKLESDKLFIYVLIITINEIHMVEIISCKCGCGKSIPRFDKLGRERYYIKGHRSNLKRKKPKIYTNIIKYDDLKKYFESGLTTTKISKIYNCDSRVIHNYKKKFKLKSIGDSNQPFIGENPDYNISYSWIKGFFEGDGGTYIFQERKYMAFTQKNPEVLYKLKYFLRAGFIKKNPQNRSYKYQIHKINEVNAILPKIINASENYEYILGLIEAEGCFHTCIQNTRIQKNKKRKEFVINISDDKIIQKIHNILKIGKIYDYYYPKHGNKKHTHRLVINTKEELEKLIKILEPLEFISSNKRRQFEIFKKPYYEEQEKELKFLKKLNYTDI